MREFGRKFALGSAIFVLAFSLIFGSTSSAWAAPGDISWEMQTINGTPQEWLYTIVSADGKYIVANSANNDYYISSDSGTTWRQLLSLPNQFYIGGGRAVADGSKLFVYGYNGTENMPQLLESSDIGSTWAAVTLPSGISMNLDFSIDTSGTRLALLDQSSGRVYTSQDSGMQWTDTGYSAGTSLNIFASSDGSAIAVDKQAGGQSFALSTDGGSSWTNPTIPIIGSVNSVAISKDGARMAVLAYSVADNKTNKIVTSTDGGVTWTTVTMPDVVGVSNLTISDDGTRLAFVAYDSNYAYAVYTSANFGASWVKASMPDGVSIDSMTVSGDFSTLLVPNSAGVYIGRMEQPTTTVNGSNVGDNLSLPARPTFSGTTYPNATVTVTVHSDPITCTATADAAGNWSCTLPADLPAGQHTVLVVMTNPSTNATTTYGPYTVYVNGSTSVTVKVPNTGVAVHFSNTAYLVDGLVVVLVGLVLLRRLR